MSHYMTMNSARTQRQRGFTLVELMVALAIVGMLTVLAAMYMRAPRDQRALDGATSTVSMLVQQLRNRAMSTGNAVILVLEAHEPLSDPFSGQQIGDGTRESRITVFDATTANCAPRNSDTLIPVRILDPSAPDRPYRHTVISRMAPVSIAGVTEICFTPTGRVVAPATSRPLPNIGSSRFGGRLLLELRPVNCVGTECTYRAERRTLSIGFNGLVERMADDFDLGSIR